MYSYVEVRIWVSIKTMDVITFPCSNLSEMGPSRSKLWRYLSFHHFEQIWFRSVFARHWNYQHGVETLSALLHRFRPKFDKNSFCVTIKLPSKGPVTQQVFPCNDIIMMLWYIPQHTCTRRPVIRSTAYNLSIYPFIAPVRGFWSWFGGVCSLTYCNGNFRVTMVSEPFNVIL